MKKIAQNVEIGENWRRKACFFSRWVGKLWFLRSPLLGFAKGREINNMHF